MTYDWAILVIVAVLLGAYPLGNYYAVTTQSCCFCGGSYCQTTSEVGCY
ncbi:Uncharacterised protein [uncultured archaeon]|nr:Uncharacterised protein [uncultured archaeon]